MTNSDTEKGRLAGLVYDVSEEEAEQYIAQDKAILFVEEKPKAKVKHGDG